MLLSDRPRLVIACHDRLDPAKGGTSDMCLRALLRAVPVWWIPGENPDVGRWLSPAPFPQWRVTRARRELAAAERLAAHPYDAPPTLGPEIEACS